MLPSTRTDISNPNHAEYKVTSTTKQGGSTASQLLSIFLLSHKEIEMRRLLFLVISFFPQYSDPTETSTLAETAVYQHAA